MQNRQQHSGDLAEWSKAMVLRHFLRSRIHHYREMRGFEPLSHQLFYFCTLFALFLHSCVVHHQPFFFGEGGRKAGKQESRKE